jgi:hypothetical protein
MPLSIVSAVNYTVICGQPITPKRMSECVVDLPGVTDVDR